MSLRGPLLAAALLLAFPGSPTPALAATTATGNPASPAAGDVREFDIPAGTLDAALSSFGARAGILVAADTALTAGKQSPGLRGRYGVDHGLAALLAGTGLQAWRAADGSYRLRTATAPSAAAPVSQLATVHVQASGEGDPADDAYRRAGSSSYISREQIERFRGTSVGDIFQGTPGVLIGENRNSGGLDINIRGMQGQGRVPVLIDGARQETTVYRGYSGVSSRSYIDPDLIGGISIDKGPSLDAGGAGAIGGLVRARTLNAEDIVLPGNTVGIRIRGSAIGNNSGSPAEPGTRSGYSVGGLLRGGVDYRTGPGCEANPDICRGHELSDIAKPDGMDRPSTFQPKSYAGSLAIAKRWDKVDLVAAFARRAQGNYYAGKHGPAPTLDLSDVIDRGFYHEVIPKLSGASRFRAGERIVNSNYESRSTLLKTRLYLPDDQELELSWLRYRSIYGELMPSQLLWNGHIKQTENSEVTVNTYASRYRWRPAGNPLIDVDAHLWTTHTRSLNRGYSQGEAQIVAPGLYNSRERYRRHGGDVANTMRFARWGETRLSYGGSFQYEKIGSDGADGGAQQGFHRNGTRKEVSLFTSLSYKPVDSLTLEAGLRWTHFSSHDANPLAVRANSPYCVDDDGDGACDPIHYDNRRSGTTPSVGLTWEPSAGLQFYARYIEAMRMPSLFESSSGFSATPTIDVNLRPEHAYNREIGVNYMKDGAWRASDKLRLKLAYFENTVNGYLTRTLTNTWEDNSTGSNTFWRMRNIDKVRFNGVELTGSYDMGPFFTQFGVTRYTHIETCLSGSFRRVECTDYGISSSYVNNMIPPNWHATATAGVRLLERRLTLGLRGTFMGRRNNVPDHDNQGVNDGVGLGSARPVIWHAYRIFDLFLSYEVNRHLSLDFNIDNITDRYYLDALSLGLVPAPGRTARLSATVRF